MTDIAALKTACDEAEAAKAALIVERQKQRTTLPMVKFMAYNESTRAQQIAIQAACTVADKAFQDAIQQVRNDAVAKVINVGTISEAEGGVADG